MEFHLMPHWIFFNYTMLEKFISSHVVPSSQFFLIITCPINGKLVDSDKKLNNDYNIERKANNILK